jgi:hypothetical protein
MVNAVAPGLFTANGGGTAAPVGQLVRVHPNGSADAPQDLAMFDPASNQWLPVPIDAGSPGDTLYIILYGSGIRHARLHDRVADSFCGQRRATRNVSGAGPNQRPPTPRLPPGALALTITADGVASNAVTIVIKRAMPSCLKCLFYERKAIDHFARGSGEVGLENRNRIAAKPVGSEISWNSGWWNRIRISVGSSRAFRLLYAGLAEARPWPLGSTSTRADSGHAAAPKILRRLTASVAFGSTGCSRMEAPWSTCCFSRIQQLLALSCQLLALGLRFYCLAACTPRSV